MTIHLPFEGENWKWNSKTLIMITNRNSWVWMQEVIDGIPRQHQKQYKIESSVWVIIEDGKLNTNIKSWNLKLTAEMW